MSDTSSNPYLIMPMVQVRADALNGVSLARAALRERDPEGTARELGRIVKPVAGQRQADRKQRILAAVGGYQRRRRGRTPRRFCLWNRSSKSDGGRTETGS
jgi:hypothetical protein